MKRLLILLSACCITSYAGAQLAQFTISAPGNRSEQATNMLTLPGDSSIIGGTITTPLNAAGWFSDVNFFLARLTPNGAITWQTMVARQGSTTDNEILHSIRSAADGSILVAGLVGRQTGVNNNNYGYVGRFNVNTGARLWDNTFQVNPNPGDVFNDVAELSDGRIIAVGTSNADGTAAERGLVCVYSAAGVLQYAEALDLPRADPFQGVIVEGDSVYITGTCIGPNNTPEARIVSYQPGATNGTIVWERGYDIIGHVAATGTVLNTVTRFARPYIRNGVLIIDGVSVSNPPATNSGHFIFQLNLSNSAATVRSVGMPGTGFCNDVSYFPRDENNLYTIENPNAVAYDVFSWTGAITTASQPTDVQTFGLPDNVNNTRNFAFPGVRQNIADVSYAGANICMAGARNTGPSNDIYYVITASNMQAQDSTCNPRQIAYALDSPRAMAFNLNSNRIDLVSQPLYVQVTLNPGFVSTRICGDNIPNPNPCDLQCYWRTNGNSSITPWNFLGTINSESIRFRTNNTQRAVLTSANGGRFGLGVTAPTSRLHVLCQQIGATPSDVRFQGLPQGKGNQLVIDGNGYVYEGAALAGGITNSCATQDFVPKTVSANGDLDCSQIYDDGTSVGISTTGPFAFTVTTTNNVQPGPWTTVTSGTLKLKVNGITMSDGYLVTSDARYKKNVTPLRDALDKIMKLNGVYYNWNKDAHKEHAFDDATQIGFIAQDVEKVIPDMVYTDKNGYKSINYVELIPVMVEAIKAQQAEIEALKQQVKQATGVAGSPATDGAMYQFDVFPNPTNGQLNFKLVIPQGTKAASITIADAMGRRVTDTKVECIGNCSVQLMLPAASMTSGNLTCNLIIDGRLVAAQKIAFVKP